MFTSRTRIEITAFLMLSCLAFAGCGDDDKNAVDPIDLTPPHVVAVSPAPGAVDVDINTSLVVTFSEDIDLDTISEETFRLYPAGEPALQVLKNAPAGSLELEYTPNEPLIYETVYTAEVDSSLADAAGNTLTADYSWTFTTEDEPKAPVEFPLAQGNAWLYESESSATVWSASGVSTSSFEGLRVLFLESPATYEGEDGWLRRSYILDQTLTTESALKTDFFYLAGDYYGLYRARPGSDSGQWMNVIRFLELEFNDSSFLIAGGPAHSDGTTLGTASVTVPAGTFDALRIEHDYSSTGAYAPEDIFETRREYFADGVGMVAATWDYSFDDNDPSGIDITTQGSADLLEPMNGPSLPYLSPEFEPNNAPGHALSQSLAEWSIVSGEIHITDSGTVVTDDDIECLYAQCVLADIDGVHMLEDWYRVDVETAGQYRLDLVYDYYNSDNDTWNDLDLYFFREFIDGSLGYIARADASVNVPEWMILLHLEVGTYYVAVQAWNTPSQSVGYTLAMRPQPIPVSKSLTTPGPDGQQFIASGGKRAAP